METVRQRTIRVAVKLYGNKGFHATSMRDIASASGCSLPTVYYYFGNKESLFDEVVAEEFLRLQQRMGTQLDMTASPSRLYAQAVINTRKLKAYDKQVMKTAMKVALGLEGSGRAREKILAWDRERARMNEAFLARFYPDRKIDPAFVALLRDTAEYLIMRIVFLDDAIADEEIEQRFSMLFSILEGN